MGKSRFGYKIVEKLAVPGTPLEDITYDEVNKVGDFWIGASDSCDICVYDDFRDSDMKPNMFIKFIDYRRHRLNIKGSEIINNYKTIIITSKQEPWNLWLNSHEEKKQWLRRMDVYEVVYDENNKKKLKWIDVEPYYDL